MQQHEFIYITQTIRMMNIHQDPTGKTIVQLRPQIQIIHNSKKKNQMQIIFTEDQARFLIPSKKELEEIYRLHLENVNLSQILREYCEKNLQKN